MTKPATQTNQHPVDAAHERGALFVGGDWACAHGDFAALRHVARRLARCPGICLQAQLAELEGTCRRDPVRAAALWTQLKRELQAH